MSRTNKKTKEPGYDFSASRANGSHTEDYGKWPKRVAHRRERRGGKGLMADGEYLWTKWGSIQK